MLDAELRSRKARHMAKRDPSDMPNLLCVEDDVDLLGDVVDELTEAGYGVRAATSYAQAMERVQEDAPDLIICDVNLPDLSGYNLLKALRNGKPTLASVPLVFLTAYGGREAVLRGKTAGADDYLVKPVDFDLLIATIEHRLKLLARVKEAQSISNPWFAGASREILDRLTIGVVLIDDASNVVFANAAARELSARSHGGSVTDTLRATRASDADALKRALAGCDSSCSAGSEAIGGVSLTGPEGSNPTNLVIVPLTKRDDGGAVAIVFMCPSCRDVEISGALLADLYGLTPTESRIAKALTQGMRREEIAQSFGVSATTVAFHLRNIMGKTETSRQTDLVAALLVALGPIANTSISQVDVRS